MPSPSLSGFRRGLFCVLLASVAGPAISSAADPLTGEQIYRKQCASCHGKAGEGVKGKYDEALLGTRTPAQLAKQIAKTMPEDAPGTCVGPDADKVAAYIHEAFYSPDAQARNKPPRVELSRLTVRQYQNAVADLLGSFRATPEKWDGPRGLKGEYFPGRGFKDVVLTQVDPVVKFDWKAGSPHPKLEADQFTLRWNGAVLAPETGEYEFVVRTDHATRLWINDLRKPLVDAWVKSGTDLEHRGNIFLIAGRVYPLRLEFSKAKQGVDDSKKGKPKPPPPPAQIALEWKTPRGPLGVIPSRNLSPGRFPETFVLTTTFPPDDRSLGWERGTTVSKEWDAAITDAAIETAGYVAARLNEFANTKDNAPDRAAKLRDFAGKFVNRAFRRPLSAEEKQVFVERQFGASKDPELALKRVVLLTLMSPRFLYREVGGGPDAFDVASRLAFALWDAPPDETLVKAALDGKLKTREQVAAQAERMLNDVRAKTKLREFLHTWLKVDHAVDLAKDAERYPGFDPVVVSDLKTSLDLFLDDVLWQGDADFRRLLTADDLFLNDRLAKFYGTQPPEAGFQKVKLNADKRAGVLTHPYVMANFAYVGASSPIHRGVFLARSVLGLNLRPPQEAFTPLAENLHPGLTTRERVALQTKGASCQSCHVTINALGFTLENFDAVGRYRDKDNNKPVDATGSYQAKNGQTKAFKNARELATFLAGSEDVHAAFVEQLFHHLVKQPVRAYGIPKPAELQKFFAASNFNMRKLAVEIATTTALTKSEKSRPPVAATGLSTTKSN